MRFDDSWMMWNIMIMGFALFAILAFRFTWLFPLAISILFASIPWLLYLEI